jgi:hypothetical protein
MEEISTITKPISGYSSITHKNATATQNLLTKLFALRIQFKLPAEEFLELLSYREGYCCSDRR